MSQVVPHGSDRPVRAFIEAKLAGDERIKDLRDTLYNQTGAFNSYRKSDPHITIIPPFSIDKTHVGKVSRIIEETGLIGRRIPISGVGVWPSIQNPRVVLLTLPVEFSQARQTLLRKLQQMGAVDIEEPVRPHITLFKTDNGYEVKPHVKEAIQRTIWDNRDSWETEIKYVDMNIIKHLSAPADD